MPSLRNLTAKAHKYIAASPNPQGEDATQDEAAGIGLGQPNRTPRIPSTPRQGITRYQLHDPAPGTGASSSSTANGLTPSDSYGKSTGTSPNIGTGGDRPTNSLRARITTPLMNDYERGGDTTVDDTSEDEGDTGKWKDDNGKSKGYRMSGAERLLYPSRAADQAGSMGSVGAKPERRTGYDARGYPERSPMKSRGGAAAGAAYVPPVAGTGLFDSDRPGSDPYIDRSSSRASYASTYDPASGTALDPQSSIGSSHTTTGQHLYPPITVSTQDLGTSNDRTPSIWSGVTQHSPAPSWNSEAGFGAKQGWGQAFKYGQAEGSRPGGLASAMTSEERLGEALMTSHFAGAGGASLGRKRHADNDEYGADFGYNPDAAISFDTLNSRLTMGRELNTRSLTALDGPFSLPVDVSTWATDGPDDDDYLHDPTDEEKAGLKSHSVAGHVSYLFSPRGLGNLGCMALLVLSLVTLFAGYPIISSQVNKHSTTWVGSYNIGGINGSGQVPAVIGHFGLIDPDTPQDAYTHTSFETGQEWELVFSDEFNTDGRSFYDGDDPYWTAEDLHYAVTNNLEWYDPRAITTENGYLKITLSQEKNHGLNYTGGMMNTWNKFCFTGGYFVASVSLPGTSDVYGLWPAVWTLGNLARPGYAGTTDGTWPYSYNQCDVGTLRNQSLKGEPEIVFTTGDGGYDNTLSYLPGQRLSRCTCENDENHPGPKNPDGSWVGRSAPEIDVLEAQVDSGTRIGHVSQSAQFAPFNPHYWIKNGSGEYTIHDTDMTILNPYQGGVYQQAASGLSNTNQNCYTGNSGCSSVYGFEYAPGDNGYVTWVSDDKLAWTLRGTAMAANTDAQVGQRPIPDEPMYLILNLGISENFGGIE
ncbi:hypothetical protein QFC24_001618 [Naganishia onofrii]|uniref:Uncharacterized protein n=1 Tax=Naganishia onofrii TaxID=1851511 RepID=A0ACC2XT00_9TREE|nr:hypothetical protein QFC24_001618 [Naganishia onofrii]